MRAAKLKTFRALLPASGTEVGHRTENQAQSLSSRVWRPKPKVGNLPKSRPHGPRHGRGRWRWCFFSRTLGWSSEAEKEPGAASYLFSHFPHSGLELDRPWRLLLAGLAAKSFRLLIFVGVSRDTFTTSKALVSMPNDSTNNFHAVSGEFIKYLEWRNCSLTCHIQHIVIGCRFFKYANGFRGFWHFVAQKRDCSKCSLKCNLLCDFSV